MIDDGKETLTVDEKSVMDEAGAPIKHNILIVNKMFMHLNTMVEHGGDSCESLVEARDYARVIEHQVHGLVDAISTSIELSEKDL